MSTRSLPRRVAPLILPALLAALAGCKSDSSAQTAQAEPAKAPAAKASTPTPAAHAGTPSPAGTRAEITEEFTADAKVTAVVPDQRIITLRREDGMQFDLRVAEGVRNFDRIAVGNTLRVRYKEVLAAEKLPPGAMARPLEAAMGAARAPEGAQPKAVLGAAARARVKVEAIDLERGIVSYSLASGEMLARRVQTPEGRKFVEGLQVGDAVQLEFTQALVLSIENL